MKCNSQASPTSYATVAEMDMYIQSIDGMEQIVINDNVYPKGKE